NSDEYALSRLLFEGFITACQKASAEKNSQPDKNYQ
ncbi:gamma-glutamyl-gamma-aminobutyrate hydrolase, partial [Hafnia alvei]